MSPGEKYFPQGKLPPEKLEKYILSAMGVARPEVLVGPKVGEDAAVIKWPNEKLLVVASDPIVGAKEGAGSLLVRVNSNDIACKGGDPAFLIVTMILPPFFTEEGAFRIMKEIDHACRDEGISIIGGHTEFNDFYDHAVLVGTLIGTSDYLLKIENIVPGDRILMTKHVGIEGMSILAGDCPQLFDSYFAPSEIDSIRSWADFTSVLPESRILRKYSHFMHDPTEGGLIGGLAEIGRLSQFGLMIDFSAIPVHPLTRKAAENLGFDPLHLISSGVLLAIVPEAFSEQAKGEVLQVGIPCTEIGKIVQSGGNCPSDTREELWDLLKKGGELTRE